MLKRNLIAIIIVTLGVVFSGNAFGQGNDRNHRPNKKKPEINRQDAQIKPMYVANQEEYMAGGIADVRGGVHNRGAETTSRKKQNNSVPKPNAGFFDTFEQGNDIRDGKIKTTSIKSPRDVATGQVMNKNCQEFESVRVRKSSNIQSPRDVASRQATGIKSNATTTGRKSSELVTEITFPKVVKQKNAKWELGEYDASKNKSAKPKGSNLGDTGTHERRKGRN
jgi:hypothetical protein